MTVEFDDDDLQAAFADYRVTESSRVRAAGVAAAQRRGLARRRRRYGFLTAVAAAGLLAPAAALALSGGGGTPIGTVSPGPQPTGSQIPIGGLTRAQLMVSSVDMPVFEGDTTGGCPHGEVGFADDRLSLYTWPETGEHLDYADIDKDGSYETVLHVRCTIAEKLVAEQVLVVAPGSGGAGVKLMGRVVGTGGDISAVDSVATGGDFSQRGQLGPALTNAIHVKVAGPRACCETFYTAVEHQRRVYVWDGQGFKQQVGSDRFGQRPSADLVVTAQELRLESGEGSFQLTVANVGTQAVDSVELVLVAMGLRPTDPEWHMRASVADPASVEYLRRLVGLQPGQSRIVEVHVSRVITSSHSGFLSATVVGILGGGELYDEAADATPANNDHVEVVIRSE